MRVIELDIPVEPVAKARPRVALVGGHARAYTPAKTRNAEAMIKTAIRYELKSLEQFPAGIPLEVVATFYRPRPKSLPKRVTMPVTKPDLDNYAKTLLDALNKYLFPDDSQITDLTLRKRFTDRSPCIHLVIQEKQPEELHENLKEAEASDTITIPGDTDISFKEIPAGAKFSRVYGKGRLLFIPDTSDD